MRIVLIGGGGHASDVLGVAEALYGTVADGKNPIIGFVDDDEVDDSRFRSRGIWQIGRISDLAAIDASHYILATGYPAGRQALHSRVVGSGLKPASFVHPGAHVPDNVVIGSGTVIFAGVCLSPLVSIGDHVYISHGALLGHDCSVCDYVSVMPGAAISGDTVLGSGSMIGTHATIIQGVVIGRNTTIGAGAVVLGDVPDGVTAVGVPAKWS